MKVDLTGVDSWEGAGILGPGEHEVEVADAKEGTSSGGYEQVELELKATDPELAGDSIRDWIVVTPATLGKVKQMLEAFGVGDLDSEIDFDPSELIGKRCRIVVRLEPYNGQDRSRVKAYQTAGAATNGSSAGTKDDTAPLAF